MVKFRTEGVGFEGVGCKVRARGWEGRNGVRIGGEVRGPAHIITSLSMCTCLAVEVRTQGTLLE